MISFLISQEFVTPAAAAFCGAGFAFILDLLLRWVNNRKKDISNLYKTRFAIEKMKKTMEAFQQDWPFMKIEDAFKIDANNETKRHIYNQSQNKSFLDAIRYGHIMLTFTIPSINFEKLSFLAIKNVKLLDNILSVNAEFESIESLSEKRNTMLTNQLRLNERTLSKDYVIRLTGEEAHLIFITEIILKILERFPNEAQLTIKALTDEISYYKFFGLYRLCK